MKTRQEPKTNYEHALEALFEKDRPSQLGLLFKGLIHNLNGPLQNLSMLSEMLSKGQSQMDDLVKGRSEGDGFEKQWMAASEKHRQWLQRMAQQVAKLAEILWDFVVLMDIERNEAEVDLRLIIERLTAVFRSDLFFKHHVKTELRMEKGLPYVAIHGRDMVPALTHIFQNAITALKNAPEKNLIIECFRESPEWVQLVFRDSGLGLVYDESMDDPCDLFFSRWPQSGAGSTERHVGFGLFAVRRLLEPYGVVFRLERQEAETLAILRIPVAPRNSKASS